MATTTNFSWATPDDSANVKDGAAAIRSLGTAVDTTVATMVPKSIVDAKGDIIAATAADTVSKLTVGSNDTVLTADSSTATGLKWAAVAGGYSTYQLFTSSGTFTVPTGITKCAVYMVSAGGGGGSGRVDVADNGSQGGGGGSGGNIAFDPFFKVTPADVMTVTIGAGGTGGASRTTVNTQTNGAAGSAGSSVVFGSLTVPGGNGGGGGSNGTDNTPSIAVLSSSNVLSAKGGGLGAQGEMAGATPTYSPGGGILSILSQAGSTGSAGTSANVGTTFGNAGTSTTAGFCGGGGGGGGWNGSNGQGGNATYGGGGGGASAYASTNITVTAGAGGAGATNRGSGGGGGGAAQKRGTSAPSVTSGAGGNGGSGFVAIFY